VTGRPIWLAHIVLDNFCLKTIAAVIALQNEKPRPSVCSFDRFDPSLYAVVLGQRHSVPTMSAWLKIKTGTQPGPNPLSAWCVLSFRN
jgi:hypothetical protein